MSIAASVVVTPSRRLLTVVALLCLGIVVIAGLLAAGWVGELALWLRLLIALFCAGASGIGFMQALRGRENYHLDISGAGQIRLRKLMPVEDGPMGDGMLVVLLADSTLWPWLLMLRLKNEAGQIYTLPILPDSLSAESFRTVSVACRWIAAHRFSEQN